MKLKKLKMPHFAGKALGMLLGLLLGGWPGAALGLILGHSFDFHRHSIFTLAMKGVHRLPRLALPNSSEQIYRDTLFLCLGYIAKQNGRISPQEIAAAEALFKRMQLRPQERDIAIARFNEGKLVTNQVDAKLEELRKRFASKKVRRLDFVEQLINMAYAGGPASDNQIKTIQSFLPLLNVSPLDFDRLHLRLRELKGYKTQQTYQKNKSASEPVLLAAYRTLGVNSDASPEEIKLSYRKLMSLHHPDKLIAQGLTERALEKGKEKAQEIQHAYGLLKKARGL